MFFKKLKTQSLVVVLFVCLGIIQSTQAGEGLFPVLGGQRVGTSAMTFLKIPVGARGEAMGGAYVALANDPFAVFWNPAGIAQVSNRWKGKFVVDPNRPPPGIKAPPRGDVLPAGGDHALGAVRIHWIADITYDALSYIQPLPLGVLSLSFASLGVQEMEVTTEYQPDGTGEYFSYGDALFGLSYALAMTDNFSWGVTFKYARETLADTHMDGVMIDLGTYYWTGYRDLRIGVALVHFGPNMRPAGTYSYTDENNEIVSEQFEEYSPPTEFRLGGAMTLLAAGPHKFLTAFQLNHPVDNAENFKLGLEYGFMGVLFLRGGLKLNTDEDHWTLGAGVRVPARGVAVSADYSYTDFGVLQRTSRLSIGVTF